MSHIQIPAEAVLPPAVVAPPLKPSGPTLLNKQMSQAERIATFKGNTSPAKLKRIMEASTPITAPVKKKLKVKDVTHVPLPVIRPPVIVLPNTAENRQLDRESALAEAPEFTFETDLDKPVMFKFKKEVWLPAFEHHEPVVDFTTYCFTCLKQLQRRDRSKCTICNRFVFVECGEFPETWCGETYEMLFHCCFCKDIEEHAETFTQSGHEHEL